MRRIAAILALLPLLAACTAADLADVLTPADGARRIEGIAYGAGPRHRLDLYVPRRPGPLPMVVFFYGGSWQSGDRADFRFVGQALASRGYLVAIPDYRLHPEVEIAGMLDDSAAAVAWVADNAAAASGRQAGPLFLAGHSAGAYNAVMLTLDRRWLAARSTEVCGTIAGTVGLAGPYDFLPLSSATLRTIFGPEPERPRTQPINHARGNAPPLLLLTGDDDGTVRPRNSEVLARRINDLGGEAKVVRYPGVGHLGLIGALVPGLRWYASVLDEIDAWLSAESARQATGCS